MKIKEKNAFLSEHEKENVIVKYNNEHANSQHCDFEKYVSKNILKLSVKDFVSHISAYKEHTLKYLLDFKELDFDSLAKLHFLVKIPKMNELNKVKFKDFVKPKNNKIKKYNAHKSK